MRATGIRGREIMIGEVADPILFLFSRAASFITGIIFDLNGGPGIGF